MTMRNDIEQCRLITLPRHESDRGVLTEVQNDGSLPFTVKRVFYVYDVPADAERGAHAHRHDSEHTRTFTLRRPFQGLFVPPGLWLHMKNFSSGSIALVLVSAPYTEEDYIRNYADFQTYIRHIKR